MAYQALDLTIQNAYADLLGACMVPAFDGTGLSFTRKKLGNKEYVYVNAKVGRTPIQKYLGAEGPEVRALIKQEEALWSTRASDRETRARLVDILLAGGVTGVPPQEGRILRLLERSGLFLAGGVLIGTPAFRAIGNLLGVAWREHQGTRDVDIAVDRRLPVAIGAGAIDLGAVIRESGMGFVEVPMLNRKYPSTSFALPGGEYSVELLTPEIGKPARGPVVIPSLNAAATPLRFLDYLIASKQPAVLPFDIGILVNVPDPGRFAVHKLVVSQRRPAAFAAKSRKDIAQAQQVIEVLLDIRPGMLVAAIAAAKEQGGKFLQQYRAATKLLPAGLMDGLSGLSP